LIHPRQIKNKPARSLVVPLLWNDLKDSTNVAVGTYALQVLIPKEHEALALEMPQLYNSYYLYVNDSLIASNGKPSASKAETVPQWKPQIVTFKAKSDTVKIVLQLSNFYHHKGGIREPIFLGTVANIQSHFKSTFVSTIVEVILAVLLALFFVCVWKFRNKNRISIHFALFCIAWAMRELFSDVYPVSQIFPDINWFLLVRTEYITLFLIIIFSTLFMNRLFADISSQMITVLIIVINFW
jgi:hypothetical protein